METTFKPYQALVLNIPHASTNIPEEFLPPQMWHKKKNSLRKYQEHARLLIDYYTDELFSVDDQRINPIVFDLCRALCDVERMVNDPLEEVGYGIVCRKVMQFCPGSIMQAIDYNPLRYAHNKSLLMKYLDYQHRLAKTIVRASYNYHIYTGDNSVLLLDCHSFSSIPTALCDPGPFDAQVDICIGYNDDATRPGEEMIDFVLAHFEELGYKVGRNTPFSHSKTVECPVPYHSLMIEVNKRCYMDEQTLEKTDGFYALQNAIRALYEYLLDSVIM